jgi:hypothetical protein
MVVIVCSGEATIFRRPSRGAGDESVVTSCGIDGFPHTPFTVESFSCC